MTNPLRRSEIFWGTTYTLLEFFVLPTALTFLNLSWQFPLWLLNCILFFSNFLFSIIIYHRFLRNALRAFAQKAFRVIGFAVAGLFLYYALSFAVSAAILTLFPDFENLNNTSVSDMAAEGGIYMVLATVVAAPVAEELLFRGLLFRGIYDKSRWLAWLVSVLAFSAVHVTGYLDSYEPAMLAIAVMQYLPAGICLAWAYRKADNIMAPIIMHILINSIAMGAIGFVS